MNFKTKHDVVKHILTNKPETRDNDMVLYSEVVKELAGADIAKLPLSEFIHCYRDYKLPNVECVGRIRRKVQSMHPELKATDEMQKIRTDAIDDYVSYARATEV